MLVVHGVGILCAGSSWDSLFNKNGLLDFSVLPLLFFSQWFNIPNGYRMSGD